MSPKYIESIHNQQVKWLQLLQQKSSERRAEKLFVVEGRREVHHCLHSGHLIDTLFVCPDVAPAADIMAQVPDAKVVNVSRAVYEKLAYRGSTEGIVAVVHQKQRQLSDLHLPPSPLIVVLESVEKPGNLGAILRSADAAKVDAVIVCDALTDLYNPNLIRSSIGAIFTVPTIACTSEQCINFLQAHNIQILTAQLQDSDLYYDVDMRRGTAFVMGTESTGLTQQWRNAASAHIRIPMLGQLDSLNVSVSAAILMFEAVRQRMQSL